MKDFIVFESTYNISSYEVDQNSRARLTSMLNYMQDAAWLHYRYFETYNGKLMPDNYVWLLSRIRLEAECYPLWGEKIIMKTWSPGLYRMFALRDFCFYNENEKPLIKASTVWHIIDTNKDLPVRPDFFKEKWTFAEREPLFDITQKVKSSDSVNNKYSVKALYSDIDINRHVNNVKYVEWMLDSYDNDFLNRHIPAAVQIDFTGQAVYGDNVWIRMKQLSENTFYTNAVCDNKEFCRMVVSWKEPSSKKV